MSDIKLKPCPHCGREDCCASAVDHGNTKQERWWGNIFCRGCNMNGPDIGPEDTFDAWFEKAVEVWNALPRHLQWTTDTPTEPGWYWYRLANGESSGDIVRLYDAWCDGRLCVYNGLEKPILLRDFHGGNVEWAGPIPEPQEPK